MSLSGTGTRDISNNTFSNLSGNAITFGQNATVSHNIITNVCMGLANCAAITNSLQDIGQDALDLSANVQENFITNVGTGITYSTYQLDGILLDTLSRSVQVTGNTISNAQTAITIMNGRFHTISNNTIYNPRTYGIRVVEDGSTYTGVVQSNAINNNTILTYNPDYSMVRVEDKVDNIGTLATFLNNTYLNTYKPKLPIIEVLENGGDSAQIDKSNLSLVDASASNFTYFGYKTYTSTGSYSGSSLITN